MFRALALLLFVAAVLGGCTAFGLEIPPWFAHASIGPTASPRLTASPSEPPSPSPTDSPAPAAVTLGPPVRKPTSPPVWSATDRAPDAVQTNGDVRLEMWVPHRTIPAGQWITVSERVTNVGTRSIWADCGPTETSADLSGLFEPGRAWIGTAGRFKSLLVHDLTSVGFAYRRGDGIDCPGGDIGQVDQLDPGEHWDIKLRQYVVYPFDRQAFPSGDVPLSATLRYGHARFGRGAQRLTASSRIAVRGTPLPGATPPQLADALLEYQPFRDWLETTDPDQWVNTDIIGGSFIQRVDWARFGFHNGPFPPGTASIGLFADSGGGTSFGQTMMDPWTATVLEFVVR